MATGTSLGAGRRSPVVQRLAQVLRLGLSVGSVGGPGDSGADPGLRPCPLAVALPQSQWLSNRLRADPEPPGSPRRGLGSWGLQRGFPACGPSLGPPGTRGRGRTRPNSGAASQERLKFSVFSSLLILLLCSVCACGLVLDEGRTLVQRARWTPRGVYLRRFTSCACRLPLARREAGVFKAQNSSFAQEMLTTHEKSIMGALVS